MKTYLKTILRMFKRHFARILNIVAIIIVSVGFMSGLGEVDNKVKFSFNDYYKSQNISDFEIKCTSPSGFSKEDIDYIKNLFGEKNVMTGLSYDEEEQDLVTRYVFQDFAGSINKLNLVEGHFPENMFEVVVERKTDVIVSFAIGDTITYNGMQFIVCGIVENPLLINKNAGPSYIENKNLNNCIYFALPSPIVSDLFVTIEDRNLFNGFSTAYKNKITQLKNEITLENATILTLSENYGIYSLYYYADKVADISIIFILFFLLVTSLVVFSNMTRLIDEERPQIACMKTLGFSSFQILLKYVIFISVATLFGGLASWFVGRGLIQIIYNAFSIQYIMPAISKTSPYLFFVISLASIFLSSQIVTIMAGYKLTKTSPALLLVPKAPHPGKKVILEKIPFIWNKLSFKYKSCIRNILLFKSRFFMTLISIIGSTILVLSGMGLLDCAIKKDAGISIIIIAIALIIFAGLLCALVIYNIVNINISERNREIASLMVLGYHKHEVAAYMFREIYITSTLGALLGLPLGVAFLHFAFSLIDFGTIGLVNWWTWILAPVITIIFAILSSFMLYKKIANTDMNKSLKSVE